MQLLLPVFFQECSSLKKYNAARPETQQRIARPVLVSQQQRHVIGSDAFAEELKHTASRQRRNPGRYDSLSFPSPVALQAPV